MLARAWRMPVLFVILDGEGGGAFCQSNAKNRQHFRWTTYNSNAA